MIIYLEGILLKITSKRLYNGYQTDDLKFIIDYINAKYPKAKNKFLIGFSLGSMVACQYAVDFDDLDGVVCISHTIRPYQGTQFLEKGWKNKKKRKRKSKLKKN